MDQLDESSLLSDPLYQQAQRFLAQRDWEPAEGLLWRLQQRHGPRRSVWIEQPLGLTLLMQGLPGLAWQVLEPWLKRADRNFWVAHLAGDAQRALNAWDAAISLYRQALADGSNSPITARNLLQVLWQRDGQAALEQLEEWQRHGRLSGSVLAGMQAALADGQALMLDRWCWRTGHADLAQLLRLLEDALQRGEREMAERLLHQLHSRGDQPWLLARLDRFGLRPGDRRPGSGPSVDAGWV